MQQPSVNFCDTLILAVHTGSFGAKKNKSWQNENHVQLPSIVFLSHFLAIATFTLCSRKAGSEEHKEEPGFRVSLLNYSPVHTTCRYMSVLPSVPYILPKFGLMIWKTFTHEKNAFAIQTI